MESSLSAFCFSSHARVAGTTNAGIFIFFSLRQFCFFLMISLLFLVRFFFYSRRKIREITSKKNRAIKMRRDRRHTRRSELCKIKTSLHSTIRSKTKLFTRAAYTQTHIHTSDGATCRASRRPFFVSEKIFTKFLHQLFFSPIKTNFPWNFCWYFHCERLCVSVYGRLVY